MHIRKLSESLHLARLRLTVRAAGLLERWGFAADGLHYIGGSDNLPAPLPREQEETAIRGLEQGDESAKQTLIEHNLRLVVYIARRFENTGINLEDLISIGTIGLIKAVSTFKPAKNIKLATYASRCIENEILMHLRKVSAQRAEVSFDEPLNTDWDGNELLLSDILGTEADEVYRPLEDDVDRRLLREAVSRLSDRERSIIHLRFGLDGQGEYTQKQVADLLGISQSYISRLEKRIIHRLHRDLAHHFLT
jgi:RNA polymerase sporulation-specific sigma factor